MTQDPKVRQLTTGAMMAAMFVLLTLLSSLPVISLIFTWFIPLPIILYVYRYSWKSGLLVIVAGTMVNFLIVGILAMLISALFAIIGLAIGYTLHNKRSKTEVFLATSLATLVAMAGIIVAYMQFTGINLITDTLKQLKPAVYKNVELSEQMAKLTNTKSTFTNEMAANIVKMFTDTMPAMLFLSTFILAWLLITINFPVIKKLRVPVPKFPPIKDLRLPRMLLLFYFAILLVQFIVKPEDGTYLYLVYVNAYLLLSMLFFLQGVSFIHFMVARSEMPKAVAWVATIFAIPLNSFITLLGIIDLGFGLRALLGDKKTK